MSWKRPLLALATLALLLPLAEGLHSLLTGRPLLVRDRRVAVVPLRQTPVLPTDAARHTAAEAVTGMYRIHEDPRVRYVLRGGIDVPIFDSTVRTDALGLRRRPGPPPPEDALRIVVLGDSVAFGYGVNDDQTPAACLERLLVASRGPGATPVACFTVAVPSWNHLQALAFLTDHWDELRPDIVVYLPIPNDLGDAGSIYEAGTLRVDADPAQPDPWLVVNRGLLASMEWGLDPAVSGADFSIAFLGPWALESDLTPESRRRYDENARSIVALAELAEARGARLLVVHPEQSQYAFHLDARLTRLAPELSWTYLERYMPSEFSLGFDGHPNAATCEVRANWIAAELLARGWVERGAGLPLPEVPEAYAVLRDPPATAEELRDYSERTRAVMLEALLDEVDFVTGRGLRQVIGGINVDRSARMHVLVALKARGPRVHVALSPLEGRPDLLPLRVDVEVAGVPVGTLLLDGAERSGADFALPPSVPSDSAVEVGLFPARFCVQRIDERSQVAAFRPLRIACPAP